MTDADLPARNRDTYRKRYIMNEATTAIGDEKLSKLRDQPDETDLTLLYVLMQPTRQKIIKTLRDSKEPLYIKQISDRIGEDPRNVSFHLATLAEYGFVDGEYREIETITHHSALTGKAAKFYRLTPKVDEVTKKLASKI